MSEFDVHPSTMFDLDDTTMNPSKFDEDYNQTINQTKFEQDYNQTINQSSLLISPTASPTLSHASFSSESRSIFDDELDFPFIGQSIKQSINHSNHMDDHNEYSIPNHSLNHSINEPPMMRSILTEPDIYQANNQSNNLFDQNDFMFDQSLNFQSTNHSLTQSVNQMISQSGYDSEDNEPGRTMVLSDAPMFNQPLDQSIQPIRQAINGSTSIIQSVSQSNNQSNNQSMKQSINPSNNQSSTQPPSQPKRVALAPLPPPESTFSFTSPITVPALANLSANQSTNQSINRRDRSSSEDADDNSSVGSHQSAPVQSTNQAVKPSILQTPLAFHPTCPASPASAPHSHSFTQSPTQSVNQGRVPLRLSQLPPPGKPGRKRKNRAEGEDESIPPSPYHQPIKSEHSSPSLSYNQSMNQSPSLSYSQSINQSPSLHSLSAYNGSITLTDLEPLSDPILEAKRLSRLQRNRASAQLSRERKKAYMTELEGQVKEYQSINQALEQQMNQLIKENKMLKERIQSNNQSNNPVTTQSSNQAIVDELLSTVGPSTSQVDVVVASPSSATTLNNTQANDQSNNQAKRAKLSAAKRMFNNQSGSPTTNQTMTPRATLLMFSLILSIAFFCSIVSLDRQTMTQSVKQSSNQHSRFSPSALAPGPFRSRVLQSVPEQPSQEKLALNAPPPLERDDQPNNQADSRALVAVKDSCSTQALVLNDQSNDQATLYDRIERFSFNNQTIDQSPKKSVLLCPNPISIRSPKRESSDQSANQSQRSAKRLRRTIGLPLPAPSDERSVEQSSKMVDETIKQSVDQSMDERLLLSTNDLIDLWLPESEFANQSINQSINQSADAKNGFVQVTCQISSINRH